MSATTKIFSCLLLSLTCLNSAFALPEDRTKPIELEADQAKLNNQTGIAEYHGNVVIIQGTAELRADKVILHTVNNEVTRMEAFGTPAKYQQILQPGEEPTHIEGLTLDLMVTKDLAKAIGNGKVYRGSDILESETITYSLKSGELNAVRSENSDSNSRVKMIFHPPAKEETNTNKPSN